MYKKKTYEEHCANSIRLTNGFDICTYENQVFESSSTETHNYYELFFYTKGNICCFIDDKICNISPGDLVIVPPGLSHKFVSTSTFDSLQCTVIWVSRDTYNNISKQWNELSILDDYIIYHYVVSVSIKNSNRIHSMLIQLLDEKTNNFYASKSYSITCLAQILLMISRNIYETSENSGKIPFYGLSTSICEYINGHLSDNLLLDNLEVLFYHNKYYLSHLFKEDIGMSIHSYIVKARLEACCSAIAKGESITKAYTNHGFRDYSSFYRLFIKQYGISPRQYQRNLQ